MHRVKRWVGRGNTRALVISSCLFALVAAPAAMSAGEGRDVRMGVRNPSSDKTKAIARETQIFSTASTYGTRQSNKSNNGGGAMYGCRSGAGGSPANMEPCVRANNLNTGLAFEFHATDGKTVGTFRVGKPTADSKPFTTNAPGVATGLNSDKLDGRDGEDFAEKGDLLFATITPTGNVAKGRGAQSAAVADAAKNTFLVTFDRDVSKCSFTATQSGGEASTVAFAAQSAGTTAPASTQVRVDQSNDGSAAVPFDLQVVC